MDVEGDIPELDHTCPKLFPEKSLDVPAALDRR